MRSQCRVEGVKPVAPISHADFMIPIVVYSTTRLIDGRSFRVRMPRRTVWRRGEIVTLENSSLKMGNA